MDTSLGQPAGTEDSQTASVIPSEAEGSRGIAVKPPSEVEGSRGIAVKPPSEAAAFGSNGRQRAETRQQP